MLISILRHGSVKVQFMSFSEIKVAFGMIASAPSPVLIVLERYRYSSQCLRHRPLRWYLRDDGTLKQKNQP
jgi:hypothetical protein